MGYDLNFNACIFPHDQAFWLAHETHKTVQHISYALLYSGPRLYKVLYMPVQELPVLLPGEVVCVLNLQPSRLQWMGPWIFPSGLGPTFGLREGFFCEMSSFLGKPVFVRNCACQGFWYGDSLFGHLDAWSQYSLPWYAWVSIPGTYILIMHDVFTFFEPPNNQQSRQEQQRPGDRSRRGRRLLHTYCNKMCNVKYCS